MRRLHILEETFRRLRLWALLPLLVLTGCNITTSELLNTAVTTGTAAVGVSLGAPVAVVAGTTAAAGITTAAITKEETGIDLTEVPEEDRAGVVKYEATLDTVKQFGLWGGGAAIIIFGIGYYLPRRKERDMHEHLFNDPDYMVDDNHKIVKKEADDAI